MKALKKYNEFYKAFSYQELEEELAAVEKALYETKVETYKHSLGIARSVIISLLEIQPDKPLDNCQLAV